MRTMNKAEQQALARLYNRDTVSTPCKRMSYREFRKTAHYSSAGCWIVQWCGMWVGIESDGYTHS